MCSVKMRRRGSRGGEAGNGDYIVRYLVFSETTVSGLAGEQSC